MDDFFNVNIFSNGNINVGLSDYSLKYMFSMLLKTWFSSSFCAKTSWDNFLGIGAL